MLRELAQALEVLSTTRTIVLWLEDLHWSDHSSLAVLAFLAGRRDPARLCVVGSFRPGDARTVESPLHRLALQLRQRGQARELALGALDEVAVKPYVGQHLGNGQRDLTEALGAFIHRRTDGNALFTVTMMADLIARKELAQHDGEWTLKGSVAELERYLPDTLRHLVLEQYERLAESDRRLIEAASVAGFDFSLAALAAALAIDVTEAEERCILFAQRA